MSTAKQLILNTDPISKAPNQIPNPLSTNNIKYTNPIKNQINKNSSNIINKTYIIAKPKKTSSEKNKLVQNSTGKEKMIKLRYHGVEKRVPFDEFMMVKNLDKQKLQANKDSMIQVMKRKIEFYKHQDDVYDMEILNKISSERENELRYAILDLQKEMRRKRDRSKEEMQNLYTNLLIGIKKLNENVSNEIDQRKSELMDRIMLSLANCDYKQALLLEAKLKEQEELFRHLHMFTFEMQQIRDNFEDSVKQISSLTESNFELRKKIFQEKLKLEHIIVLMKEYKSRIKNMVDRINKYKDTNRNYNFSKNISNLTESGFINNFDKNIFKNNIKKRGRSANNKLFIDTNSNSIMLNTATTSSNINTNSNFHLKISKINKLNEEVKGEKQEEINYDLIGIKTERENINDTCDKIISVLKKNIIIWSNKKKMIENKKKDIIPDNVLYDAITSIVEKLRNDEGNKEVGGINNRIISNSMRALPVQNKQFRKIFLDLLFRNNNIFEAIKYGQKEEIEKYFNKNLFGAVKK